MKDISIIFKFLSASISGSIDDLVQCLPLSDIQWNVILQQSTDHRVCGLVCSVIEKLPPCLAPPTDILLQFYGNKIQQIDDYNKKLQTARLFTFALHERGVEMVVLKGVAFGTYYDDPTLRDFGDCDCYLGEKQIIGDQVCAQLGGGVEHGTYKHSHLNLNNLLIENHRFFTDFNGTKQGKKIEEILEKELNVGANSYIGDTKMICPNPRFNALFLLKHHLTDFLEEGMVLRMIFDWTCLLKKEQNNIDWQSLYEEMTECGLRNFADVLTSISVKYIGLELTNTSITLSPFDSLVNDVITDTLFNTVRMKQGESMLYKMKRILFRFKRMWHFRKLSYETYPMMFINSFLFCYSIRRNINLSR